MRKLFAVLLLLFAVIPQVDAQDYSTTPMQVEKTFNLTVTTLLSKPDHKMQVFAINDPETIEWFTNCWNNPLLKDNHVRCGEFISSLMTLNPWHRGVQLKDSPNTYVWRGWGGPPVLITTLIVAVNDYCVGAYVIPDDKAHGNIKLSVRLTCGEVKRKQPDPETSKCPPTRIDCEQMPAVAAMVGKTTTTYRDPTPVEPAPAKKTEPSAEELRRLADEGDKLKVRASTASQSLDNSFRRQAKAGGYAAAQARLSSEIRADIVPTQERIKMYLAKGDAALKANDTTIAQKYYDLAEEEIAKVEKFLGEK